MGTAVTERLLATGHTVYVYNRSQQKTASLIGRGAQLAESPADAASAADVVITLVTDGASVREVTHGPQGILSRLGPESVHCDMSTVAPSEAARIAGEYVGVRRRFVQAPVLGGRRQIERGELLIFAGGQDDDVDRCREVWGALSRNIWRFPVPEQAATLKLACNMMIAQMIVALGQSLVLVRKSGIPGETLLEVLAESSLGAPMFEAKGAAILRGDYSPNFTVSNLIKDLTLADAAGREVGTPMIANAIARQLFLAAESSGFGSQDYSAVTRALEVMAGINERA